MIDSKTKNKIQSYCHRTEVIFNDQEDSITLGPETIDDRVFVFAHDCTKFPVKINSCKYNLEIAGARLETLENFPGIVAGHFSIDNMPELKSLEFGPDFVGDYYAIGDDVRLTSLKGIAKTIRGELNIRYIQSLSPYEMRYALLTAVGSIILKEKDIQSILSDGRVENTNGLWEMPSDLIPGKIKQLKDMS